jgi:tetratricopeptide (TPR) repeat protein
VTGRILQSGTGKPFSMSVPIVALCGEERFETEVKLSGAEAKFKLATSAEPDAVVVDPDWELLIARDLGDFDPKKILEAAMKVANTPGESNADVLARAVADLRGLLAKSALSGGEEGAAHTAIGRCLFRLGQLDEAEQELNEALRLGAGGPFHRGWAHLRLGCIADLRKDRKAALEHYRAVVDGSGSSKSAVEKAEAFLAKPYRGYASDG